MDHFFNGIPRARKSSYLDHRLHHYSKIGEVILIQTLELLGGKAPQKPPLVSPQALQKPPQPLANSVPLSPKKNPPTQNPAYGPVYFLRVFLPQLVTFHVAKGVLYAIFATATL